jgi:hypothetical protein
MLAFSCRRGSEGIEDLYREVPGAEQLENGEEC